MLIRHIKQKRQLFIVLIERERSLEKEGVGPYTNFSKAEGDSNAWHGVNGQRCSVLPLTPIEAKYRPAFGNA